MAQLVQEKEARLRSKLADKYKVDFERVDAITWKLYGNGMAPGATKQDIVGLMLAIPTSAGMPKTAVIDPHITLKFSSRMSMTIWFGSEDRTMMMRTWKRSALDCMKPYSGLNMLFDKLVCSKIWNNQSIRTWTQIQGSLLKPDNW